jgi:uncharacterized protein (TIGR02266 family)
MPFPEKRASESAPVVLRIKLRYETVDSFVERLAIYINRDGMFLRSPAPKPVGTRLIIELRLANGTLVLECEGVVRWLRGANPEEPAFSQGMGVEFRDVAPESEEVMALIEAARARRGWKDIRGIPGAPSEQLDEQPSQDSSAAASQGPSAAASQGPSAAASQGPSAAASQGPSAAASQRRRHVTVDELMARAQSAVAPDAHASELDALMAGDASAVVTRALTRARELASHADDQELEALLAANPEPGTASTAEASSWLAAHLGGSAIAPRPRAASHPVDPVAEKAEKAVTRPAERPVTKAVTRPAEKMRTRPAARPVERTAAKPATRPVDKMAAKPAAKPDDKMAAGPVERTAAKPAARPVDKMAAKPATRPVENTAEQPADRPARRPAPATAARQPAPSRPARATPSPLAPRPAPVAAPAASQRASYAATVAEEHPAREPAVQAPVHAPEAHEDAALTMADLTGDPVSYPSIEIAHEGAQTAPPSEDARAELSRPRRGNFPATEIHVASLPAADEDDDLMVTIEIDGDDALDSLIGLAPASRGRARPGGSSVDEEFTVVRGEPAFGSDGLYDDAGADETAFVFEEPSVPEGLLSTPGRSEAARLAGAEPAPEQPAQSPPTSLNLLLDDDFGPEFDFPADADASGFFDHLHHDSGPVLFRQNQAETQFADVPTLAIELRSVLTDSEAETGGALENDDIDALVDSLEFNASALDADGLRASNLAELSQPSRPSSGRRAASQGMALPGGSASALDDDLDHTVAEVVDNLDEIEALEIDPDMLEPADEDEDDMENKISTASAPPPLPPGATRPPPVPPAPRVASESEGEGAGEGEGDDDDPSRKRGFFSRIFNK